MGHSQSDKAASRERILDEAARQVRDAGLESVSVARLMRSVGLTHGGFYGHFASRSELLAQALQRALDDGAAASRTAHGAMTDFDKTLRSYLSRKHRDMREDGCAIAALASDVARADEASRTVMSRHIDDFTARVAVAMGTEDEGKARFALAAMIGALLVSRVMTDPVRSDALLAAVREQLGKLGAVAVGDATRARPAAKRARRA